MQINNQSISRSRNSDPTPVEHDLRAPFWQHLLLVLLPPVVSIILDKTLEVVLSRFRPKEPDPVTNIHLHQDLGMTEDEEFHASGECGHAAGECKDEIHDELAKSENNEPNTKK